MDILWMYCGYSYGYMDIWMDIYRTELNGSL